MRPPPRAGRAFSGKTDRHASLRKGGVAHTVPLRDHPRPAEEAAFPLPRLAAREKLLVVQHEQLPPWALADDRPSPPLRSLAAWASRVDGEAVEQ
jgi:hypothetical protein